MTSAPRRPPLLRRFCGSILALTCILGADAAIGCRTSDEHQRGPTSRAPSPTDEGLETTSPGRAAVVAPAGPGRTRTEELLEEVVSPYSHLRVRQDGHLRKLLFVGERDREAVQSTIDVTDPDALYHPYTRGMLLGHAAVPKAHSMLIIGLGGGSMVRYNRKHFPALELDVVEIDSEVVRIAEKWFGVRSGARTRITVADGVAFMASARERWDVIHVDAFWASSNETDSAGIPEKFKTRAFLDSIPPRLEPGGVAVFNLHHKSTFPAHLALLTEAFPSVAVFRVPRDANRIILAAARPNAFPAGTITAAAAAFEEDRELGFSLSRLAELRVDG